MGTWLATALAVFGLSIIATGGNRIVLIVLASSMVLCSFFLAIAPWLNGQRVRAFARHLRQVKLTHISLHSGLLILGVWLLLEQQQPLGGGALIIAAAFALFWTTYRKLFNHLRNEASIVVHALGKLGRRPKGNDSQS